MKGVLLVGPALMLAQPGTAQEPARPALPAETAEEVVVTARPRPPAPLLDAIGYYRRHCFEANRLSGRSAPPIDDPDWEPLDAAERGAFDIADPRAPVFRLTDPGRGHVLYLRIERLTLPCSWRATEERCTLVVVGGRDHATFADALSRLFRGPGTRRHVGHRDGVDALPGWDQRLWTGMPGRGSGNWRVLEATGAARGQGTWLKVFDPDFYRDHDYILGDLKTSRDRSRPTSILGFAYIHRE